MLFNIPLPAGFPMQGDREDSSLYQEKFKPGDNLSFPGTLPAISRVLSNFPPTPFTCGSLASILEIPSSMRAFFHCLGYSGGFVDEDGWDKGFIGTG